MIRLLNPGSIDATRLLFSTCLYMSSALHQALRTDGDDDGEAHLVHYGKPVPQPLAVLIEQVRKGCERKSNKCQRRVSPAISQIGVQLVRTQGQQSSCQTPQHRRRSDRTSGPGVERIDQVRRDGHHESHHALAKDDASDNGQEPVQLLLKGPAIDDQADRCEGRAQGDGRQSHLGRWRHGPGESPVDSVRCDGVDPQTEEEADPQAEVGQAGCARGPSVHLLVHRRHGAQHQKHHAEDHGQAERGEGNEG